MELVITSLLSPELSSPRSLPPDPSDCWVTVSAEIGLKDEGSNVFNFYFVTLKRLASLLNERGFCIGRHLIIVDNFDWNTARQAIKSALAEVSGKNWDEIAPRLAQYGEWEFDNFQE